MSYDMIRRDGLLEFARNHIDGKIDCNDIARFPYANAEPVRHGRWIKENIRKKSYLRLCSDCGKIAYFCGTGCSYKYCPHCGAKMDAEVEG